MPYPLILSLRWCSGRLRACLPALRMAGVATTLAVASAGAQAPLDIRIALIIGNSAYVAAPALENPANDARAMADVLATLGFQVVELRNGNRAQMAAAIAKVRDALKDKQGVGMLYYAGHGLQLDWHNYMVPVDARLGSAADVPQQALDLGTVIEAFKGAGNRMNIVVLDACRDNPFADGTSTAKGLAQLDAPTGTFLAYATAPGNVAEDGDEKSGNGLYTQFLLQELKRPIAKIEDVFKRVRLNVRRQSQGRQIPWESTSLEDDFYFNDGVKHTIKPEQLERMAAEVRAREQQRLAQAAALEAQARERERLIAQRLAQEQERQQAEARALEEQRLALEAQARQREQALAAEQARERERQQTQAQAQERERLAVLKRAQELERQQAEARALEEKRLALETQARELAQAVAAEQAREQERQQALAQAREQQRLADAARASELERMAALAKAPRPEKSLSKEELATLAFKEQKEAWDRIKGSNRADDFYAFLERFPSAGEMAEMAQFRLDQIAKPKIKASLGQGQDASLGYTGDRFKRGDLFEWQVSDLLTNIPGEKVVRRITAVNGDTVEINGGKGISTMSGAIVSNSGGSYDPPFGAIPTDLQLGKKWSVRSTRQRPNGELEELRGDVKVVARETITVPAGTFQTYVMETSGFIGTNRNFSRKLWWDPRYGFPIKTEEYLRNNGGRIVRSDRQELVTLKAERS